ncbi:protein NRT1/ PTR FAMILY 1.2-like isoform X2 [Salvia miltiorrhiza]|uniref:protein NRT1/ PTR FAMILY 1.2-like isoform X2 n=1 Tax=Salvia miltiorrhiza TaxID=226208 RepID=UPI0025AC9297|nr:protein NRT1/ PTR FAMILY 1.2-like isoform X2 [Salvia miltiorrhiza]
MEDRLKEKETMVKEPLLESAQEKGGFRTLPFIIGNEALERMATFGLSPNMTLYLINEYHMQMTTAANVLFMWSAATNFMPIVGAVIADSYLGRFHTIGFGSIVCLVGIILLWSTAVIPQARPPPCDQSSIVCSPPMIFQFLYLCLSFGLISIGAGGIRSSSLAFGADQLEKKGFHKSPGAKQSYFGWYYASLTLSILVALTCVVYIQENLGWGVGFAVPGVLMLVAVISFFLASPFYVRFKSSSNLITGFAQVAVASFRNRHLKLSDSTSDLYLCRDGFGLMIPSEKLRFLNKACVVRDVGKELTPDGRAANPWRLCTVERVEELKALLRVIPIWFSGMIMSINMSQSTFPVLQAVSMDREITSSFEIPAASFGMFAVVAVILWVVLYDRAFLPLASRLMGRPVCVSARRRMAIGIFLSFLAMIVSAAVEAIRRSVAIETGKSNHPQAVMAMSALWLVPQNFLTGFAEASNAIAQNEFYFSELPRSMSSIASTLLGIGMCLANILASSIMNTVDYLSRQGGDESWISSNINKGHYDYYYLVLAGLSMANMYFLGCSAAFGPSTEEGKLPEEEENGFCEGDGGTEKGFPQKQKQVSNNQ